jgi:hypothetical protein
LADRKTNRFFELQSPHFPIDDPWHRVVVPPSSSKESLGGRCIAPIRQQKVDGLPGGIDRPIKEAVSSFDVDVRPVRFVAYL